MKVKLIDSKLLTIGIIFLGILLAMTITSVAQTNKNNIMSISDMQADYVTQQLVGDLHLLESIVTEISQDENLIYALQKINEQGLNDENEIKLRNSVDNFLTITTSMDLVNQITISSVPHKLLFANNEFSENYNVYDMLWFDEDMEYLETATTTRVHRQWQSTKQVVSVVKFMIDDNTNEVIGAVILEVLVEDIINSLKNYYTMADVDIFIEHKGNTAYSNGTTYLTPEGIFTSTARPSYESIYANKNVSMVHYDIIDTGITCIMIVDLDSLAKSQHVISLNTYISKSTLSYLLGIIILVVCIIGSILMAIVPAIIGIDNIIQEIDEDYEGKNIGIDQINLKTKFVEDKLPSKLEYLMYYDELTGLVNRKMLRTIYRSFVGQDEPFVVVLLDIKNFKSINDTLGNAMGDRVLIDIALRLNMAILSTKKEGMVVRCSGDEFMIMLHHGDMDIEEWYNKKIVPLFLEPLVYLDTKPILVEFNAAAIVAPQHSNSEADLLNKIYIMIRRAKVLNTTSLVMFNNDIYSKYVESERIKNYLKIAIDSEEFVLNYQPIVDGNKKVQKAEALIRWFSKDLGFVPPDKFISIAEQTGLIINLGNWIIERVAKDLRSMLDTGRQVQVSINISAIQIMEKDFVETVKKILARHNIEYKYVCFEITESILLQEINTVKDNIKQLRELGIQFALDDFGTGYSSFSYLKEYSLDIIKIDKMFVDNLTEKDYAIIKGIKNISDALEMHMVIEGVETAEQFDRLKPFGLIQGYYFSRPIVWAEFEKMVE
ncbi:MAG: hypothetical protein ATN35_08145 [Epulopiscium sp. Nele67-Bin004]|nr:MAG: hypothetical protein ATN35_08145 [Epulopiscium sp. Nele67-Bin004]